MNELTLSPRLLAAADAVPEGSVLADIGTDHGFLAIYLLRRGDITHAYLTDINEGPLSRAKDNMPCDLLPNVDFMLTDGAAALGGLGISAYAICGMGGELIADIISRADDMHKAGVRLILQPMSRHGELRRYLFANGFDILSESYVSEGNRFYICISAEYSGIVRDVGEPEINFGDLSHLDMNNRAVRGYLQIQYDALMLRRRGKLLGGLDTDAEDELISYLKGYLKF